MTTANGAMNARAARKSLGDQIDRLDGILDGLAEALNESVADAVRGVISHAVSEAVHAAVKEVLSSPDLLRAALARHEPAAIPPQSIGANAEVTPRRTPKGLLRRARDWVGSTMTKAAAKVAGMLSSAWTRSLDTLRKGCARLFDSGKCVVGIAKNLPGTLIALGAGLWRYRAASSVAVAVGAACAIGVYHAGPAIGSAVSGFASAALAAAGMVLLPLWRLVSGGDD